MVLDAGGKLVAHLGGHERMGDGVLLEVFVQSNQIQPQFLGDDIKRCAGGQRWIHIHHTGIKTIAGISRHIVLGLEAVETLIPIDEGHQIAVDELATLGDACRA